MGKGEWQGTLGNNLVANALVGYWDFDLTPDRRLHRAVQRSTS